MIQIIFQRSGAAELCSMNIRLIHTPTETPYREAIAELRRIGYYQGRTDINVWDEFDAHSSHILAFDGSELVGKIRITTNGPFPVTCWSNGQAEETENRTGLADFSRAVTHPRLRGLGMYGLLALQTLVYLRPQGVVLARALVEEGLPARHSLDRLGFGLRLLSQPSVMPPDKEARGYLATANPSDAHWQKLLDARIARVAKDGIIISSEMPL